MRTIRLAAAVLAGVLPAAARSHDLIALAEVQSPARVEGSGLVVGYHLVEVFAGEPDGVDVVVRHVDLEAEEHDAIRHRMPAAERVILLADRDPGSPGRYRAAVPLRATPAAIESFRAWSAPADVRPEQPLDDVLAEATDVTFARPGERPPDPAPLSPVAAAGDAIPAEDVLYTEHAEHADEERIGAGLEVPDASSALRSAGRPDGIPDGESPAPGSAELVDIPEAPEDLRRPAPPASHEPPSPAWPAVRDEAAIPEQVVSVRPEPPPVVASLPADVARPAASPGEARPADLAPAPPFTWDPAFVTAPGPGLPPPPPPSTLGPPLAKRRDLHAPEEWKRK